MVVKDQQNRGNKDFFSFLIPETFFFFWIIFWLCCFGPKARYDIIVERAMERISHPSRLEEKREGRQDRFSKDSLQ